MKLKTVYLKVHEMEIAARFWSDFLKIPLPAHIDAHTMGFSFAPIGLGLLCFAGVRDGVADSNCGLVFEYDTVEEVEEAFARLIALGTTLISNKLDNPIFRDATFTDPSGNHFTITHARD